MSETPDEVVVLLDAIAGGDRQAAEALLPLVYSELRRLAESRMAAMGGGPTLQPTALVHEAYLKLIGRADPGWDSRGHFFGAAARAMRDILVDIARRKSRIKHGGGRRRVDLAADVPGAIDLDLNADEILALDDALGRLRIEFPRQAEVVLLRYFGGQSNDTTAQILGVTSRTVERDWRFARAWLHRALEDEGDGA